MPANNKNGMVLCGQLNSETDLQEWLKTQFNQHGWTALDEVSPHNSNLSADLIVNHDRYGWLGIELKHCSGKLRGHAIADAHHQITRKYRGKKYLGHRITNWAVCVYHDTGDTRVTRELLCRHGIGFINLNRSQLLIDYAHSTKEAKIPVYGDRISKYKADVDVKMISRSVKEKMQTYPYRS